MAFLHPSCCNKKKFAWCSTLLVGLIAQNLYIGFLGFLCHHTKSHNKIVFLCPLMVSPCRHFRTVLAYLVGFFAASDVPKSICINRLQITSSVWTSWWASTAVDSETSTMKRAIHHRLRNWRLTRINTWNCKIFLTQLRASSGVDKPWDEESHCFVSFRHFTKRGTS